MMAVALGLLPPPVSASHNSLDSSTFPLPSSSSLPLSTLWQNGPRKFLWRARKSSGCFRLRFDGGGGVRAMVQPTVQQGPSAAYAREMERLSAKESLLLAFKDSGGFDSLVSGRITDMQRIDVTERITSLERLNPTPRPTTSPYLEGKWNLDWFDLSSPGLSTVRSVIERVPITLANVSKLDVWIKDGYGKLTVNMRLLNSIESKFILSSKFTVEGPLRMKEEYIEVLIESPVVIEEAVPQQLRSVLGQATNAFQQLPVPIRDAVSNGFTVPLSGTFQRLFMISYLDDEILIIRDTTGKPEVLTRLDSVPSSGPEVVREYES